MSARPDKSMDLAKLKERLQAAGVVFEGGLTQEEIELVEASFSFQFPPDLKSFLMFALPTGRGWPNWRDLYTVPSDSGNAMSPPLEKISNVRFVSLEQ